MCCETRGATTSAICRSNVVSVSLTTINDESGLMFFSSIISKLMNDDVCKHYSLGTLSNFDRDDRYSEPTGSSFFFICVEKKQCNFYLTRPVKNILAIFNELIILFVENKNIEGVR